MCILFIYYTLLKVVSHYDVSVMFVSVMGFQKSLGGGGGEINLVFFEKILTLQNPLM